MADLANSAEYPVTLSADAARWNWQKLFLATVAALASTILLKFGAIQYLELVYLGLLIILLLVFVQKGYRATWFRPFFLLAMAYIAFIAAAFALALASLRFDFYLPLYPDPLKAPVIITIARIVELVASMAAMLYMAQIFRANLSMARFTMRIYFWVGVSSGVFSLLCLPLSLLGLSAWGVYSDQHRARGFYNEGGPYGLYVMSVLLVGIVLDQQRWERRTRVRWTLALMAVVFLMCYSKAAMCAVLTIFVVNALIARSLPRRLAVIGVGLAVLLVISRFVDLTGAVRTYQQTAGAYEKLSYYHSRDPNFVYGRVAGAFLVPRMIAAHPLTGIGWGNYGNLRNAPEYRGAAVFVEDADDPGLGIFGIAAELGLPLLAFLLVCLFLPFFYLRQLQAPTYLTNLALLQPIVHLYGAQLNLTYPWVATAFALGVGYGLARVNRLQPQNSVDWVS